MGFNYRTKLIELGCYKMTSIVMIKPLCSFCCKEMQFVEGDIIFGDKWYHMDCKKQAELAAVIYETTIL
jgi:hypothetical protein